MAGGDALLLETSAILGMSCDEAFIDQFSASVESLSASTPGRSRNFLRMSPLLVRMARVRAPDVQKVGSNRQGTAAEV